MKRKIYSRLLDWKNNEEKKALLLIGARQTGKTYILKEFASKEYLSYVYFNLEERSDVCGLFESEDRSGSSLINRLSFLSKVEFKQGRTVLILDEIQSCIQAYSSLKTLVLENRCDVIASGSLLGVRLDDLQGLSPMGYVNILRMYPMDFEEYMWAMGYTDEHTEYLRNRIQKIEPIDKRVLGHINDEFRRYLVIGGMPSAVLEYSKSGSYVKVSRVLDDILNVIGSDAEKYSKNVDRFKIRACFDSIPAQLAKDNKKFQYSLVEKKKGARKRTYDSALQWLEKAGLINYCFNLSEPVIPLKEKIRYNIFKVYAFDTGVLVRLMEPGVASEIVNRDAYANNGAILENAIACSLVSLNYMLAYYERDNSTLEVDFIYNDNGKSVALEVKSGKNKRAKSLKTLFTDEKRVSKGIKLVEGNILVDENKIIHYPLFAPCFFNGPESEDILLKRDSSDFRSEFDRIINEEKS